MAWSVDDPEGQQGYVPGIVIVAFRDEVTVEQARAYLDAAFKPESIKFDWREHPQLGVLRRADIRVKPGTEDEVMAKLRQSELVKPTFVARMLKVIYFDQPPAERKKQFEAERINDTGKTLEKIDHKWVAEQLGAEEISDPH